MLTCHKRGFSLERAWWGLFGGYEIYLEKYLDFYNNFKGLPHKKVDEALWAYGKFLTLDYCIL